VIVNLRAASLTGLLLFSTIPALADVVVPESSTHSTRVATDGRTRARLHAELASMYFQDGNMAVALEEAGSAIQADSSFAMGYNVRALVYMALRDFAAAEADFRKALSLAPGDPDVNNNFGWFLCQRDRARESLNYFLTAIKNPLYSTPDRAYTNAGICALKAGDPDAARQYLEQALRISQDGAPLARLHLAKLAYAQGNLNEAKAQLMEMMRPLPQPPAEALWLGLRIERKLGNKVEEGSLAAQLRRLYPTSQEYQEFLKGNYE
jgi:type IV pilus assembly protein PilF